MCMGAAPAAPAPPPPVIPPPPPPPPASPTANSVTTAKPTSTQPNVAPPKKNKNPLRTDSYSSGDSVATGLNIPV